MRTHKSKGNENENMKFGPEEAVTPGVNQGHSEDIQTLLAVDMCLLGRRQKDYFLEYLKIRRKDHQTIRVWPPTTRVGLLSEIFRQKLGKEKGYKKRA